MSVSYERERFVEKVQREKAEARTRLWREVDETRKAGTCSKCIHCQQRPRGLYCDKVGKFVVDPKGEFHNWRGLPECEKKVEKLFNFDLSLVR